MRKKITVLLGAVMMLLAIASPAAAQGGWKQPMTPYRRACRDMSTLLTRRRRTRFARGYTLFCKKVVEGKRAGLG